MASSDILQWDPTGTNIEDQTAYAADAVRLTGYVAGLARSDITNKALRQATFMAAGLANFMVAQGISVPDDGNLTNLVAEITSALTGFITIVSGAYAVDTGLVNAMVVTLTPPVTSYPDGFQVRVKVKITNTGPTTLDAGGGAKACVREDGTPMQNNDLPAGFIATFNYVLAINSWEFAGLVQSQFGALAFLAAGTGVRASGGTLSGVDAITYVNTTQAIGAAQNASTFVLQSSTTLTVARTATVLWNGFFFDVDAQTGVATITPDSHDSIGGQAAGVSYSISQGQSARFISDGAGNIAVKFLTLPLGASPAPQYINSSQAVGPGQYSVDTSAGPITLTLSTTGIRGATWRFLDAKGTWSVNNLTVNVLTGGYTITPPQATVAVAENLTCDVSGEDFYIWFDSATLRMI